MPPRTALVPLADMRAAIRRIERYTRGMDVRSFRRNDLVLDAVERCLEIISEASRRLPSDLTARHPDIPWRKVRRSATCFATSTTRSAPMMWEILQEHLPPLKRAVHTMVRSVKETDPASRRAARAPSGDRKRKSRQEKPS
jgi:uncharacterized protein with HEPN domain